MHYKLPELGGDGICLRAGDEHLVEDMELVKKGILDHDSFVSGFTPHQNPVEAFVYKGEKLKELGFRYGIDNIQDPRFKDAITQIRRTSNLRTTQGRDSLQRGQICGVINSSATFAGVLGAATGANSSTTFNSTGSFPSGALQGQRIYAQSSGTVGVYGVIMSNTANQVVVDQWYNPTSSTATTGAIPTATCPFMVSANTGTAQWLGLSTDTNAASANDILRSADGLFGISTSVGMATSVATELVGNGMGRQFVQPTFPQAGQILLTATFTYTANGQINVNKAILCNSLPGAGSLLFLETLLANTATVNGPGDSIVVNWTISL